MDSLTSDSSPTPAATSTFAPTRSHGARFWWPYGVAILILLADRASKIWVEQNLGAALSGKEADLPLDTVLRYQENTGAAFSFLRGQPWVFTAIAIVVAIGMVIFYQTRGRAMALTRDIWLQLPFGLILGGVVGNLIDRLTKPGGGVTDFVVLPWARIGNWQFAVFNVADSGISVGVTILIAATLIRAMLVGQKPVPVPVQTENAPDAAEPALAEPVADSAYTPSTDETFLAEPTADSAYAPLEHHDE